MTDYTHLYNEPPRVKRLHPDAQIPTRAHDLDAGFDLYALEPKDLPPGGLIKVRTGVAIGVPAGQVGDIRPRSGLASAGITVANAPGTIDPGYTGEIVVLLVNHSHANTLHINPGDRVAQIVFTYTNTQPLVEVEHLGASERGECGFGSTGH